jgi:hypothetical protein
MRESLAPSTAVLPTSRRSAVSAKAKLEQRSKSQVTIHKHVVINYEETFVHTINISIPKL